MGRYRRRYKTSYKKPDYAAEAAIRRAAEEQRVIDEMFLFNALRVTGSWPQFLDSCSNMLRLMLKVSVVGLVMISIPLILNKEFSAAITIVAVCVPMWLFTNLLGFKPKTTFTEQDSSVIAVSTSSAVTNVIARFAKSHRVDLRDAISEVISTHHFEMSNRPKSDPIIMPFTSPLDDIKKKRKDFYSSQKWQTLRYKTLAKYPKKCMLCGATNKPLHVDHIKPRSKYPTLALDPDNMQILCEDCNLAKSNRHEDDFRTR